MLPLLRVLPIGSLLMTLLILLLATTPPGGLTPALPSHLAPARGPLIDANEHPEWRQFIVQAAYRRAEEVDRLRALPDTPTRMPVVEVPKPAPVILPEAQPAAPEPAPAVQVAAAPAAEPITATPLPEIAVAVPAYPLAPEVSAAPVEATVPAPPLPPQKVAALPAEPEAAAPEEITGTIRSAEKETLPIDIGETSSTELPIVLPRARPPIKRIHPNPKASHAKPKVKVAIAHSAKAKRPAAPAKTQAAQPNGFRPFSWSAGISTQ